VSCTSTSEDINSGLVAYYPFDGNIYDLGNGGNHVKAKDVFLTSDRFRKENSACGFDGIKSSLLFELTNIPAMDSAKTISWWYFSESIPKYDSVLGAENMIVLVDPASGIGIQFGFRAPGYNTRGFDSWEWGGGTFLDMAYPEFNSWHHCIYTYDGTTHSFYLDGEIINTSTVEPKSGTPNQLMLGNYPGGDQFFIGKLDDIRIYNRILTVVEIEILFSFE